MEDAIKITMLAVVLLWAALRVGSAEAQTQPWECVIPGGCVRDIREVV
jgi:hypothetical protein